MSQQLGIPKAAMDALIQLVDHNAEIKPGMEVLIGAHIDGAYGSANHVDPTAVSWVQAVCASRGANCTVLWIDEVMKKHQWRVPPILKGAITNADVFFNFSLDLAIEENAEFRTYLEECKTWYVRMFPVTTGLMMTDWARTPHELVIMCRHLSSNPFMNHMAEFEMSAPNGSQLTGNILDPVKREGIPGMPYNSWRKDASHYIPWPEWVHPPVNCKNVNGVLYFDRMLPYWARYMGLPPVWETPIKIEVKDSKMVSITGGKEADLLKHTLGELEERAGEGMKKFDTFHFGIHPNATVTKDQCPNDVYRRIIEHSGPRCVHWHLGSAPANPNYNFYPHVTGDLMDIDLKIAGKVAWDKGYMLELDNPELKKIAAKYPDLPGIPERI
jgi:hypothetical protein